MADQLTPVPSEPSFLEKLTMPLDQLWQKYKGFVILFGLLILIVKFRDVIIDLLVSNVHKTVDQTKATDAKLQTDETNANNQANQLRKEAEDMPNNETKVSEDWYKKK